MPPCGPYGIRPTVQVRLLQPQGGSRMYRVLGLVVVGLATLALVACDASNARTTLEGPESVVKSEPAFYDVTTTGLTPILSLVGYWIYLDLDGDGQASWDERLFDSEIFEGADRLGDAHMSFWFVPESIYQSSDRVIPTSTTVFVQTTAYWTSLAEGYTRLGLETMTLKITSE